MYRAIAGADPLDSTCLPDELGDLNLTGSVKGLKVGLPREYFIEGLDPEVKAAVDRAVEGLVANGAEVVEVSLPHTGYNVPVYYLIAPAEASSNLARFDGIRYGRRAAEADGVLETYINSRSEGFGPEVKRRIMLGTYALSSGYYDAYYGKAQQVRTLISKDFARAFEQVDVIVTPTTPTPAFKFNERLSDPLSMYLADLYTIAANLAGLPAMSVPCGKTGAGLPVGLQVIAPPLQERRVFDVGLAVERGV
jgi:aspartyl-tRNA(Asn)/glutamyl-tRNA(Gln) amidotransferase subunit A